MVYRLKNTLISNSKIFLINWFSKCPNPNTPNHWLHSECFQRSFYRLKQSHTTKSRLPSKKFSSAIESVLLYTFSVVSRSLKTALAIQNLILSYIEVTFKQASVALGCKLYFLIKYLLKLKMTLI